MTILVATQNPGKLTEIQAILAKVDQKITDPAAQGLETLDVEETGHTFAENALIKAKAFAQASHLLALADDSGLEISALNGKPGVYSKRFAPGSDADRNQYVLQLMQGKTDRQAAFKTILCLYDEQRQQPVYFEGELPGRIALEVKGQAGFGYDPIFIPTGYDQTLAELGSEVKNTLSHRALALKQLQTYLQAQKD